MRIAFKMKVNQGHEEEYKKRHNPIWKELEQTLFKHGVQTYLIFLDPDSRDLFGYAEIESLSEWQKVADTEICKKWWDYMMPLMPCNEDHSPVSKELQEVFHIEK